MLSNIWIFIIAASVTSLGFRVLPCFLPYIFKNSLYENDNNFFASFLNYSACAIIGGIIYLIAFHSNSLFSHTYQVSLKDLLTVAILLLSFFMNLILRKPIVTFLICVILYFLLSNLHLYI